MGEPNTSPHEMLFAQLIPGRIDPTFSFINKKKVSDGFCLNLAYF